MGRRDVGSVGWSVDELLVLKVLNEERWLKHALPHRLIDAILSHQLNLVRPDWRFDFGLVFKLRKFFKVEVLQEIDEWGVVAKFLDAVTILNFTLLVVDQVLVKFSKRLQVHKYVIFLVHKFSKLNVIVENGPYICF
jgi:hypothetical protein